MLMCVLWNSEKIPYDNGLKPGPKAAVFSREPRDSEEVNEGVLLGFGESACRIVWGEQRLGSALFEGGERRPGPCRARLCSRSSSHLKLLLKVPGFKGPF